MSSFRIAIAVILTVLTPNLATSAEMDDLYFVDAHSQLARGVDIKTIMPLMDQAGVWHTILSAYSDRSPQEVAFFADEHPQRLTAAIRSKGKDFRNNSQRFPKLLNLQLKNPTFRALAESMLFHARKANKPAEIVVKARSPQNQLLIDLAKALHTPFVAHYEFGGARADKARYIREFEVMVDSNKKVPFVLIHMGQLKADEARLLIKAHPNVYFMMSHSNPLSIGKNTDQPWVNLFKNEKLAPQWEALALEYPDRFILAFDSIGPKNWGKFYLDQAKLWRTALKQLPNDVAQALAHGNAERLWNLPVKP